MNRLKLGPFTLDVIETGRFRLDAGAMFGVVPRTLWSRVVEVDEKSRMTLASRCLLIRSEASGRIYLVDNGCGDKFDEKMSGIYAIDQEHSELVRSLEEVGVAPELVTDLIFTHLHFDHCGGTTFFEEDEVGSARLQERFPNAIYHVTEDHLATVRDPNAREIASFLPENVETILGSDRLHAVADKHIWEEGLFAIPSHGHTAGMQLPVIEAEGKRIVFCADLIPTAHHLPLPWVMAYDMEPLKTLDQKPDFLRRSVDEGWYLFLEHDPDHEVVRLERDGKRFRVAESMALGEIG